MTREDAIEIIRKNMPSDKSLPVYEALQTLIPELAESENEKIRKSLIKYFLDYYEVYDKSCGEPLWGPGHMVVKDILAWLEKQKESLHISETCKENPNSFTNEDERIRKGMIDEIKAILRGEDLGFPPQDVLESRLAYLEKQKEQKPKMTPRWLYRLEFKDSSCGLWYDGTGKWCFESGIGSIADCKTKNLPMDYDERYKQEGRD